MMKKSIVLTLVSFALVFGLIGGAPGSEARLASHHIAANSPAQAQVDLSINDVTVKAEHTAERIVTEWGYTIVGQAERQHRHPDIAYRAFWIGAVYQGSFFLPLGLVVLTVEGWTANTVRVNVH